MNYKDFFSSALSEAFDKYTFSDTDEMMKSIRERAESMKNSNENTSITSITEISGEYIPPKKSRRVLNVVAGAAAAAAVIGAGAFGVDFLKTHGGLREEGDDSARAGYHEDSTFPDVVGEIPTAASEQENVFDFGAVSAVVDWWQFDGKEFTVQYDIIFDGEPYSWYQDEDPFSRVHLIPHYFSELSESEDSSLTVVSSSGSSETRQAHYVLKKSMSYMIFRFDDWDRGWAKQVGDLPRETPDPPDSGKDLYIHCDFLGQRTAVRYTDEHCEALDCNLNKLMITSGAVSFELSGVSENTQFDGIILTAEKEDGTEITLDKCTFIPGDSGDKGIITFTADGNEFGVNDVFRLERIVSDDPISVRQAVPDNEDIKTFDIQYRAGGEPYGIQETADAVYAEGRTYLCTSRLSFDEFIPGISSSVSAYRDENGSWDHEKLFDELETVDARGFLDNEAAPDRKYYRGDSGYILCVIPEDESVLMYADAGTVVPELPEYRQNSFCVKYNDIRHIIELLWTAYEEFPDISVTAVEDTGNGEVTLEISVSEEEMPILKKYLSDNGADLSLCRFLNLFVF